MCFGVHQFNVLDNYLFLDLTIVLFRLWGSLLAVLYSPSPRERLVVFPFETISNCSLASEVTHINGDNFSIVSKHFLPVAFGVIEITILLR